MVHMIEGAQEHTAGAVRLSWRARAARALVSYARRGLRWLLGDPQREDVSANRRMLLRLLVVGGGVFVASKTVGSIVDYFAGDEVLNDRLFQNFHVIETRKALTFYDRATGDEILSIEKQ